MRSTDFIYIPMIILNLIGFVVAIRKSQAEANVAHKKLMNSRKLKEL
jgi:hypothetical protein